MAVSSITAFRAIMLQLGATDEEMDEIWRTQRWMTVDNESPSNNVKLCIESLKNHRSDVLARNEARRYREYMSTQPDLGE